MALTCARRLSAKPIASTLIAMATPLPTTMRSTRRRRSSTVLLSRAATIVSPFAGNHPTGNPVEFYIYLVAGLLIPLVGGFWALVERDRWSTVILGIACLAIAVMLVRMNIIWTV